MKFNIDVTGRRNFWFILSALVILPGLISLMLQGLNLGIDYTGGTLLQLEFAQPAEVAQVRTVLADYGLENSGIQSSGGDNIIIRTTTLGEEQRREVLAGLEADLGSFTLMRLEEVGAVISGELRNAAFLALAIATVLMIGYITVRFEFKFAVAGIFALFHDVLVVLGIFSILQIQIDAAFVAALLTIVGYSINDTIVSFDRIRENLKGHKRGPVAAIVNTSVNQIMVRSINTSLTTLFAIASLLFFGGETTKTFALALFIGVISGTYSSIFTASNLWSVWRDRSEHSHGFASNPSK